MPAAVENVAPAGVLIAIRERLRSKGGQAMTEFALMLPVVLVLLGGLADAGRAFYYNIAAENVAREAVHWATMVSNHSSDPGLPPTDTDIVQDVATPSQESFGLNLGLAPTSVANSPVPINPSTAANPPSPDAPLALGQAWLFVYPGSAGRVALLPGQHWQLVASGSRMVPGDSPAAGGLGNALRTAGGGLVPMDAEAASPHCYTWTGVSLNASSFTVGPGTPYGPLSLTATVTGISGSPSPKNTITMAVTANPPSPAFSQTWTSTGAASGSLNPSSQSQDTVTLTNNVPATAGTYTYTVTASSSGSGCTQPPVSKTFTIVVQPAPSPSPSPSPTPSPLTSPSPIPTPGGEGGPGPHGHQITCTVIYYFSPVTPMVIRSGFYIVGVATMQATY